MLGGCYALTLSGALEVAKRPPYVRQGAHLLLVCSAVHVHWHAGA